METLELILSAVRCVGQFLAVEDPCLRRWMMCSGSESGSPVLLSGGHRHWAFLEHSGLPAWHVANCPRVIPSGNLGALGHRVVIQPVILGKVP